MTKRRFAAILTGLSMATVATWTSLGVVVPAAGQPTIEIRSQIRGTDRPPLLEEPVFLLLLGNDSRSTSLDGGHVDAIHVLGIDPVTGHAGLVGVTKDAWVRMPGGGFETLARVGAKGGADRVTQTMQSVSGCTFDHTIIAGFGGFQTLVNDMGGIPFDVPRRLKENGGSNIDLKEGRQVLNGEQALAWARLRKGKTRPKGDISRSEAQNELMLAALKESRKDFTRSPGSLLRILASFRRNVSHDLGLNQMLRLGQALLAVSPRDLRHTVIDTVAGTVDGRPVRRISRSGEAQFVDLCGDGALEP